jgi:selenocysteine lyase/cysteine desulfurase
LLDYNLELKDNASRFHLGTNSVIGIFALAQSLELFEEYGIENIEINNVSNAKYFIEKLSESGFEPVLKGEDENHLAGITTVKLDNAERVHKALAEAKIDCAIREGKIRFSPHFYNTKDEIDFAVNRLLELTKK